MCFYCKENLVDTITTHVVNYNNCIVIVKNVPCHKCTQCGEESFSGTVVAQLECIIDQLRGTLTEIAVVNYESRVA